MKKKQHQLTMNSNLKTSHPSNTREEKSPRAQTFNSISGSLESKTDALPEAVVALSWPLPLPRLLRAATTPSIVSHTKITSKTPIYKNSKPHLKRKGRSSHQRKTLGCFKNAFSVYTKIQSKQGNIRSHKKRRQEGNSRNRN